MSTGIAVSLEAVIVAVTDDRPRVLTVGSSQGPMLPSGALDVAEDASLDLAMRRVIDEQAGFEVEYLEQLYTFGDLDRSSPVSTAGERALGVGYLVLTREASTTGRWVDWYHLFPWEDLRAPDADREAKTMIGEWASDGPGRAQRVQIAFGMEETPWDGVRALDRYELLYEAHLVPEWFVDHDEVGREQRCRVSTWRWTTAGSQRRRFQDSGGNSRIGRSSST